MKKVKYIYIYISRTKIKIYDERQNFEVEVKVEKQLGAPVGSLSIFLYLLCKHSETPFDFKNIGIDLVTSGSYTVL